MVGNLRYVRKITAKKAHKYVDYRSSEGLLFLFTKPMMALW